MGMLLRYGARVPENKYIAYQPRRRPNIVQVSVSVERRRCSNEAETVTRNPLKFAGVPQTKAPDTRAVKTARYDGPS